MDERFQEVCCTIRACLNSTKRQCTLRELSRDYDLVQGEPIPYQALGYHSLEALVRAVPNIKIIRSGNEILVDVKPDEKTIHIANLVRGQRTAKKKSKKKSSYGRIYRPAPPPQRRPFGDASQRRKPPSPPPRGRNYYSSNTNDYSSRRREPPPFQKKASPPPIMISSEEEDLHEAVRRKYHSTRPSPYDFSDPNEFDDEGSDYDDLMEINNKVEALKVTLGPEQRQVSVNKQKFRGYHSTTSNDDDIGYSSMKTNGKSNEYKNTHSDSYEDDDDGYPSVYGSTDNSSTDQLQSTNRFKSHHYSNPNAKTNVNSNSRVNTHDTDSYRRPYLKARAGHGYRTESDKYEYSTNFKTEPHVKVGNIKVTVPNGSGRARVVAFLLR